MARVSLAQKYEGIAQEQGSNRLAHEIYDLRAKEQLDIMSITKAVAGLIVGIALNEGGIHRNESIQKRSGLQALPLAHVTIAHVLNHASGLRLPEDDQVGQIYASDDFSRLYDRAYLEHPPESISGYSNFAVNLLSLLVQNEIGISLDSYANSRFFRPLGIKDVFWETDKKNHALVMAGLHLSIEDMSKISALLFSRGRHNNLQVVPQAWIDELWQGSDHHLVGDTVGGRTSWQYLWSQTYFDEPQLSPTTMRPLTSPDLISANGYGGQFIIACRRSQLRIITQRDMDFADEAPQFGGWSFIRTIQELDEAFTQDDSELRTQKIEQS